MSARLFFMALTASLVIHPCFAESTTVRTHWTSDDDPTEGTMQAWLLSTFVIFTWLLLVSFMIPVVRVFRFPFLLLVLIFFMPPLWFVFLFLILCNSPVLVSRNFNTQTLLTPASLSEPTYNTAGNPSSIVRSRISLGATTRTVDRV